MTERNVKRILEVKWIDEKIVRVKLKATKRRKIWLKVDKTNYSVPSCTSQNCQLYNKCGMMKSPLRRYYNFGQFCNQLLIEYPELKEELGITIISQIVPIKKE
jgi:hypothetical protein